MAIKVEETNSDAMKIINCFSTKALCVVALSLGLVANLNAVIMIGNLPVDGGQQSEYDNGSGSPMMFFAIGFDTPATAYTLQDIVFDSTLNGSGVAVKMWTGSGSVPTANTGWTFNISGSAGSVTATPTSPSYTLSASTRYWVSIESATSTSQYWDRETSPGKDYAGLAGDPATTFSAYYDGSLGEWTADSVAIRPGMQLNVVPEPSQYAVLAGIGLIGFAYLRRKVAV